MGKLPAFQFYPGDWMKDPSLRACSIQARGLWIDMLCLMHESSRRGYLQHCTSNPVTAAQLARMTGCATDEVDALLRELMNAGVCSRTDNEVIYSRRMVRDEQKRNLCAEAGRKGGGNPTFIGRPKGVPKVTSKPPLEDEVEESLPSAGRGSGEPPGFTRFWKSYPPHDRKVDKKGCLTIWRKQELEPLAEAVIAGVEKWKTIWAKKKNEYVLLPTTFLNQRRWEALADVEAPKTTDDPKVAEARAKVRKWLRTNPDGERRVLAEYRQANPECVLDDGQLTAWPTFHDFVAAQVAKQK